jgi:hypothetical protein
MQYGYLDVSHYDFLALEGEGTAESIWLEDPNKTQYLLKYEYSEDYLYNEVIAYKIATSLGLQSAECTLAICHGKRGVLSKNVNHYGCHMVNLMIQYPQFRILEGYKYSVRSFADWVHPLNGSNLRMTYKSIINLLLFDYLIENLDRHYGNIGVDAFTGDLAPFYDNAASLSLSGEVKSSLIIDEETSLPIMHSEIPLHLAHRYGNFFLKYGSEFYKSCTSLNMYEILEPLRNVMGNMKHNDYMDYLPNIIDARVQELRRILNSML